MDCFCNCLSNYCYLVHFLYIRLGGTIITGYLRSATKKDYYSIVVIGFIYLLVRPYKESKDLDVNLDNVVTQK